MILHVIQRIALTIWQHWASLSTAIVNRCAEKRFLSASERRISWRTAARSHPFRIAMYLYLLFGIFRLLIASFVLRTGQYRAQYLDVDILIAIGYRINLFDHSTALCTAPLPIFAIYYDYAVHIRRYNYIWHLGHDIMVRNGARFWRLNAHLRPPPIPQIFAQPISSVRRLWTIAKQFYRNEYECVRFGVSNLKYYPYLDVIARKRLIAINCFMNLISSGFIVCTVLVAIAELLFYIFFFLLPNIEFSWRRFTFGVTDICLITLCTVNTLRVTIFLVQGLYSVRFGLAFFYLDIERQFRRLLAQTEFAQSLRCCGGRIAAKSKHLSVCMAQFVDFFRAQQITMAVHAAHANHYIISPILFTGAISHFWLNLYLISALYFVLTQTADRLFGGALISLQTLFTIVGLQPIIRLIDVLHRSAKSLLFRAQSCLQFRPKHVGANGAIICAKIKLLSHYELMHSQRRFHFTMGPIAQISWRSVFEFFFTYSAYVMLLFSMIQTSDMRKSNMQK